MGGKSLQNNTDLNQIIFLLYKPPTNDFLFTWSSGKTIYIAEYYEVEEKTEKVFVYYNPMISDLQSYYASAVKENMERLAQKVPKKLMSVK